METRTRSAVESLRTYSAIESPGYCLEGLFIRSRRSSIFTRLRR